MIVNALFAFGLSGTSPSSSTWFLDSRASNHMTYSRNPLSNVTRYNGNLQIQTANGGNAPITALGNIPGPIPLKNVYLCPTLTSNLLSVGQLVENNCNISFSSSGCVVQDQMSGKEIARGPKCGRLFPLDFSKISRNQFNNNVFCFSLR